MPQVHGPMELAMRHRTIHFRAENLLNMAEQEVGNKVTSQLVSLQLGRRA